VLAPPRTGATTIAQWMGQALLHHVDDLELHVLLVDRPVEETLDWREAAPNAIVHRASSGAGDAPEVLAATLGVFDEVSERAAAGVDVALICDSIGSLARALAATHDLDETRVLDGGLAQTTMIELRRCFGRARAGSDDAPGSLTIYATLATDTASELDDVLRHELVGTGNVEWHLSADAFQGGLFPPVDIMASGARHTELIVGERAADERAALRALVDERGVLPGLGQLLLDLDMYGSLAMVLMETTGA
jgi:transcription termination factor Rho